MPKANIHGQMDLQKSLPQRLTCYINWLFYVNKQSLFFWNCFDVAAGGIWRVPSLLLRGRQNQADYSFTHQWLKGDASCSAHPSHSHICLPEGADGGEAHDGLGEVCVQRRQGDTGQALQLTGCVPVVVLEQINVNNVTQCQYLKRFISVWALRTTGQGANGAWLHLANSHNGQNLTCNCCPTSDTN